MHMPQPKDKWVNAKKRQNNSYFETTKHKVKLFGYKNYLQDGFQQDT